MKISRILFTGIVIAGLLGLSVSAQAIDAREITDELFAGPDAISADEVMNDAAFEALRLAQANLDMEMEELDRNRAERDAEMAQAREELERAAREVARLGQELAGDIAIRIRERQPKAMLGISLGSGPGMKRDDGVEVVGVTADGPAEEAGLEAGDILIEIDGVALKADKQDSSIEKLTGYMADVEPGQKVTVGYLRDGKSYSAIIEPREFEFPSFAFDFSDNFDFSGGLGDHEAFRLHIPDGVPLPHGPDIAKRLFGFGGHTIHGALGEMEMVSLTKGLGEYFGTDDGVLIVRAPVSEKIPLRDGDVILRIGDRKPSSPGHALRILGSYEPGETVKIQVMRKKKKRELTIELPENDRAARIWRDRRPVIIRGADERPATGT